APAPAGRGARPDDRAARLGLRRRAPAGDRAGDDLLHEPLPHRDPVQRAAREPDAGRRSDAHADRPVPEPQDRPSRAVEERIVGIEALAPTGAQALLLIVAAVFAAAAGGALLITAPAQTPAQRLARYAVGHRAVSPGVAVETDGAVERLVSPLGRRLATLLAGLAPPQARRETATQLAMAGM